MKEGDNLLEGRFVFIDKMKAIGILLIMIGHAPGLSNQFKIFIYAFHVPLFFIISGFLLSERYMVLNIKARFSKLFKSLLVPYFFFFFVSWLYWCLTKQYANLSVYLKDKTFFDAFSGVYIGTVSALFVNPALWFFVALFWISLVYHISAKLIFSKIVLFISYLVVFLVSVFVFYGELNKPDMVTLQVITGLVFYSFGVVLNEYMTRLDFSRYRFFILCVFLPVFIFLALKNGPLDLNLSRFGFSPFIYLLVAVVGFFVLYFLVDFLPYGRTVDFLSRNSLLIFASHMVIYKWITGFLMIFFGIDSPYLLGDWYFNFIYVLVSLVFIFYMSKFFNKHVPFLVGARS
ncbi:acyltransferase family protein [Deefgea tanakiae]|uniref:Acyltransferase family protein n=1 Tax=Deefgea tanakiae TaxID=2865840 RepID=A0ABX8Z769_9NEIS|nr:acyltransferase family protein [Deefgea tanakiae]QZA78235.1 acyltransferase family protein [Deefgea tanakiae]